MERKEGETTCAALTQHARHVNTDILFVGSFGRKRDKADAVHVEVLGTVADQSLRTCDADVCIVKSTSFEVDDRASFFFVPVDLSDKSGA